MFNDFIFPLNISAREYKMLICGRRQQLALDYVIDYAVMKNRRIVYPFAGIR